MAQPLPDSFLIFAAIALVVFPALVLRRRVQPQKSDYHMEVITACALVPFVLLLDAALRKAVLPAIPVWIVYWTLGDVVFHLVLRVPEKWRKLAAGAALATLAGLLAFGLRERL